MVNTLSLISSALVLLAISPVQGAGHRSHRRAHSHPHNPQIARAANLVRLSSQPAPAPALLEKRTINRRSTSVQKRCKNKATSTSLVASSTKAAASTSAAQATTAAVGNVGGAPSKSSSSEAAEATTTHEAATTSHKAAATTTSTKAAATTKASSSTGSSLLTGTKSGEGTFYGTGLGACGITNSDSDYIAAVSHILFDEFPGYNGANPNNNPICGKKVTALRNGKSVTVEITDRCEGCAEWDLDFSPTAFNVLADAALGRVDITWTWN